ncbi:DUF4232 domain-containing protein [Agromyces italicus]|uniref:DUF4232 domain-containing protein n=1 Tax=Agromyces italicus TaxID=279572 RepID=UPI00146E50B9|nr:DUF4232 domain-containing protein [Agromyces italicus]
MTRAMLTAGLLFVAALALGGCAAGAPGEGAGSTADASPGAATSRSPLPSSEPESTAAPPIAAPTPVEGTGSAGDGTVAERDQEPFADDAALELRCDDSQLELAVTPLPDESGGGSFGFELVFTNTAAQACVFEGWPGLIAIDAAGEEVGWPAQADLSAGSTTSPALLGADGGVATAHVRATQAGAHDCTPVEAAGLRARITSDGAGGGIDAPYGITVCDGPISTMKIAPLVAG